jgi:alkanesulfonate monooxygenase SsuD/methylene tetrahydromethanopterin reductase-like flavin-dependent oxidoreductase (luciferase family)
MEGPPVWLAGERATMRLAARLGLPFQASRAAPAELQPVARLWKELNGGLLAHRIYAEAGTGVPEGEQVARHVVSGSAAQIADAFAAYRELGVGDLSVVLGHDDASAMRTLEVLLGDVLPALRR